MRLGTRILCCYLAVFGIGFYALIQWVLGDLRVRYLEGVEEVMVDQAHLLACLLGEETRHGGLDPDRLRAVFDAVRQRAPQARIYRLLKTRVDMEMYVTDAAGRLVFHSDPHERPDADYRNWRDVNLTLKGAYGARTTRKETADPLSTRLHVAAPILRDGRIAGVLTLIKPTDSINRFIVFAKAQVIKFGLLAALAVSLASYVTAFWLTRPIMRLTRYAIEIRDGRRARLPRLNKSEIGDMGRAFADMAEALEGRKYVEQYVQTFTHEIKAPCRPLAGLRNSWRSPCPRPSASGF